MKKTKIKAISLIICLLMVAGIVVGGTVAYLKAGSDAVENTFTPSKVTTEVVEDEEAFAAGTKKDVVIKNTGDTEAWIRAAIVVTWQNESGEVYGVKPTEDDYTMSLNVDTAETEGDWILGEDGFYYHKAVVAGNNGETAVLINSCEPADEKAPDGYSLCVEILGSGIQSKPVDVVKNIWGVTVTDGQITGQGGTN